MSPKQPPNYELGRASMVRDEAQDQIDKIKLCVDVLNEQADLLRSSYNIRCNFVVANSVVHLVIKEVRTLLRVPDPPPK